MHSVHCGEAAVVLRLLNGVVVMRNVGVEFLVWCLISLLDRVGLLVLVDPSMWALGVMCRPQELAVARQVPAVLAALMCPVLLSWCTTYDAPLAVQQHGGQPLGCLLLRRWVALCR